MVKIKEYLFKIKMGWYSYHPSLRLLIIFMLICSLFIGIAGSLGALDEFPGW